MSQIFDRQINSWPRKFRCAGRGLVRGVKLQRSYWLHLTAAVAVIVAAALLSANLVEWCLLVLSIVAVLAAELFNTAIEHLARAVTREQNEEIRDALDTSSGAVLLAAIGAAAVGTIVFAHRLGCALGYWSG